MYQEYTTDSEKLQDGKNRWEIHKQGSLILSDSFFRLGNPNKATVVHECGTYLEFKRYQDNHFTLHQANFCKVRLCPMCAWRRSLKVFAQVSKVMDFLDGNYRYLFLTLTCRNVEGSELSSQLDSLFLAFNKLTKTVKFKGAVKGWFRCLEVTHNRKADSYHPHFHIVIAVNNSYFTAPKSYIKQETWVEMWKHCLGVDYSPVIDIRAMKPSADGKGKEVAEVAKYAVKPSEYLICDSEGVLDAVETDKVVAVLEGALKNRRLYAFGGVLRDAHKRLNLDDIVDGDLALINGVDKLREDMEYIIERYCWHIGYSSYLLNEVSVVMKDGESNAD